MIGNWEIADEPEPKRFLMFANAYLQAAILICAEIDGDPGNEKVSNWPNACVCMWLAAHSVELFLKAAILKADPNGKWGHELADLEKAYAEVYADRVEEVGFSSPFQVIYAGFDAAEAEVLRASKPTPPSIRFRYPVMKPGVEWQGPHGFDAASFFETLHGLNEDYERIGDVLDLGS